MVTELEIENVQCLCQATKPAKDLEWYLAFQNLM